MRNYKKLVPEGKGWRLDTKERRGNKVVLASTGEVVNLTDPRRRGKYTSQ